MTILVTGAGNVGCEIAAQLVKNGEKVVLFDIRPSRERIAEHVDPDKLEVVTGDVADFGQLAQAASKHGVSRIVHTAAILILASQADPLRSIWINLMGAVNALELGRKMKLKRVVLSGSSSVVFGILGSFKGSAIPDDFPMRVISEAPGNFYAVSKLAAEWFAARYASDFGVETAVLRYSSVIRAWNGAEPGLVGNALKAFVDAPSRGEKAVIDEPRFIWRGVEEFVDARDCAEVTIRALFAPKLSQRIYNIVGPGAYTTEEFADIVRRAFPGGQVEIRAKTDLGIGGSPVRYVRLDGSAAARDLGYTRPRELSDSLLHYSKLSRR
jgi:UDP-glucose 4-epimerase